MRLLTAIIRADSARILTNRPVPYSDLLFHDRRADLFSFIVSLYVSDLLNVTISTTSLQGRRRAAPAGRGGAESLRSSRSRFGIPGPGLERQNSEPGKRGRRPEASGRGDER